MVIFKKKLVHVDIDDPIEVSSSTNNLKSGPEPNLEQIAMLADMGFTSAEARKALRETVCGSFFVFGLAMTFFFDTYSGYEK